MNSRDYFFLTLQSLNNSLYQGTFLSPKELYFGPVFYQNQVYSLYSSPATKQKNYTLQELQNLTKDDILNQQNNLLTIFQRRKSFLIKKHLLHHKFKGCIFFQRGDLLKKLDRSVKDLEFPSTKIYMCERVVKPFCDKCVYTPERCASCSQIPPTHVQLLDIETGKSHVSPVNKLSKIDPIDLKDVSISLDALTGVNKGVLKLPKGIPESQIWNYGKDLENVENFIRPCAHGMEDMTMGEEIPEVEDVSDDLENVPNLEKVLLRLSGDKPTTNTSENDLNMPRNLEKRARKLPKHFEDFEMEKKEGGLKGQNKKGKDSKKIQFSQVQNEFMLKSIQKALLLRKELSITLGKRWKKYYALSNVEENFLKFKVCHLPHFLNIIPPPSGGKKSNFKRVSFGPLKKKKKESDPKIQPSSIKSNDNRLRF